MRWTADSTTWTARMAMTGRANIPRRTRPMARHALPWSKLVVYIFKTFNRSMIELNLGLDSPRPRLHTPPRFRICPSYLSAPYSTIEWRPITAPVGQRITWSPIPNDGMHACYDHNIPKSSK